MAKASFEAALAFVLKQEGGYVDHPADPGGATNLGITLATLSRWRRRVVTKDEVRSLTRGEAGEIYRSCYWDAVRGDALPAGLDLALFDYAVNSGPDRAVQAVQAVLGVAPDGAMGPITLAAIAAHKPSDLIAALCSERLGFLKRLAAYPVFKRGWNRRVAALQRRAQALAAVKSHRDQSLTTTTTPHKKESNIMEMTKSILGSRTVWANVIGIFALALSIFGFDTGLIDAPGLADHLLQGVTAVSFVLSTFFRVVASKRLVG